MARSKIQLHPAAIEALRGDPGVGEAMHQVAEPVLTQAQALATDFRRTGEYADSLRIEDVVVDGVRIARVVADCDHGIYVEAEHGTLARALDAAH